MKKMLKNKWLWVGVVIIGLMIWRGVVNKNKVKNGSKEKVVTVEKRDVVSTLSISGEIKAEKQAILNFPIPGKLAYVGVRDGDEVKKGQILAYLDLGDLQAAETKAWYTYLAADAYAKKIEDEVKGHDADETFTQKYNRVSAQTTRDMAYDAWLTAKRAVTNAKLVAPFTGIVTNVTSVVIGDTVSITDGVTVVDPKTLYFEAEVDEVDLGKMPVDPEIDVQLDAFPEASFSGDLDRVGFASRISSTGATVYPVKIKLVSDEAIKRLRLGMNGDAILVLGEKKKVLAVPVDAVIDGKVLKKNGENKVSPVETGLVGDEFVEIKSGISEGERVIIK